MSTKTNKQELVMEFQRIRNVKPQFFSHEGLYDAEIKAGVPVRVGFIGLWTCCDKHGRFEWKPRQLKLKALPYDEIDFNRVLEALVGTDSIRKYEVDGKQYGYIPSWRKHQYISPKELRVKTQYPAPPGVVDAPETDLEDVPSMDETAVEPKRVGTGAVPEPGQAVSIGVGNANGNGNERVGAGNANGKSGSKAAQSHPQSPSQHDNSLQTGNSSKQPQSQYFSTREYVELLSWDYDSAYPTASREHKLAILFYSVLPEENRAAAISTWETAWAEDFAQLGNEPWDDILAVIDFSQTTKWKKYTKRAQTFVEKYAEMKEQWLKVRNRLTPEKAQEMMGKTVGDEI